METQDNEQPKFGKGDVIGCGISKSGALFFTKNGSALGDGTPLTFEATLVYLTCSTRRVCI